MFRLEKIFLALRSSQSDWVIFLLAFVVILRIFGSIFSALNIIDGI